MLTKLVVKEIFNSIEGEGMNAGKFTTFVRFAGCNLRCNYCDTKEAFSESGSVYLTSDQIIEKIKYQNVTLTGGEPLYRDGIYEFIQALLDKKYKVNLETNGSFEIARLNKLHNRKNLTVVMDYKCFSSNGKYTTKRSNFNYLKDWDCIKCVIGDERDLNEFIDILNHRIFNSWFMNEFTIFISANFAKIEPRNLVDMVHQAYDRSPYKEKFAQRIRYQLQIHKYIWEPTRKGV